MKRMLRHPWFKATAALAALALAWGAYTLWNRSMTPTWFGPAEAALEAAIFADDAQAVAAALAAGANLNARGKWQATPLIAAADMLKEQAALALLKAGANPNLKAEDGTSAVSLAVANYRQAPALLKAVLDAGGDPNTRRPGGEPVIVRFVNDHDCDHMRMMKERGADLNALTRTKTPIILSASLSGDWDSVWCLLQLGAQYDYPPGPPENNLVQRLSNPYPGTDSPVYPYKVKVRDFLRAKGLPAPDLPGDKGS